MIAPEAVFMQCSPPRRYLRSASPRGGIYAVLAPEAVFKLEYMFLFCTFTLLLLLVKWTVLWVFQVIIYGIYRPCNGYISVRIY